MKIYEDIYSYKYFKIKLDVILDVTYQGYWGEKVIFITFSNLISHALLLSTSL